MTNLIGCIITHMSMTGVIGESWTPTFRATVRGVDGAMNVLLVQITEAMTNASPPVGTLLRLPVMAGSSERVFVEPQVN